MSIVLTDDNIKWIANHPITRQNIKDYIKDYGSTNNNNNNEIYYKFKAEMNSQIDIIYGDFRYIKNDYLMFKNSFNNIPV